MMEVTGMRKLPRAKRPWLQRCTVAVVLTSVLALGSAPAMAADHAAATEAAVAQSAVRQAENAPFLFKYTFNRHLNIAGGYFTTGGKVYLVVKLNAGAVKFSRNVIAHTHPITPGGAIYVETTVAAPCAPGNNGYAQAYDYTTKRWSPRLPVTICQRID
jgi:hypothetical protein